MSISIYIDSCAWNYLYKNGINLKQELPSSHFKIYVTREVEIELSAIPETGCDGADKRALKAYIKQGIDMLPVETSYVFGLDSTPSPTQVYGGLDVGMFQSEEEIKFYAMPEIAQQLQSGKKSNSGLGKNEADASLAAKSFSSIVLTNERMNKTGPLKVAADFGGKIVYLEAQVKPSGLTIGEYLESI